MKKIIFISILIQTVLTFYLVSPVKPKNQNKSMLFYQIPVLRSKLAYPIDEFKNRITKKTFGMFISPKNSPIKQERFTGYHTGIDVEYEDVKSNVPVYAIADGTVVLSRYASGYGGVFIIKINLNGLSYTVLYGHIRPGSLPKIGQKVLKGEKLAFLGTGYSKETDGERRHLHFAVLTDGRIDLKGYVQTKSELSGWIDPLILYHRFGL